MDRSKNQSRLRGSFGRFCAMSAIGAVAAGIATTARANLNIVTNYNFTDTTGFPGSTSIASSPNAAQVEATLNADIATLESYISNNVTVTIDFVNNPTGLGTSLTNGFTIPYSEYHSDLVTDQTPSVADVSALATLPAGSANPTNGSSQINIAATLLRALEGGSPGSNPDSVIGLNLSTTNTGRGNGSTGADLESTALHEMDEALGTGGFGSALNEVEAGKASATGPVGVLDLFRFSSPAVRSYSTSANVSSYFSIDDGATALVHFNQSSTGDYGDWGDGVTPADSQPNSPPQVQDAYTLASSAPNLGANELTALDVVGWNLTLLGTEVEEGLPIPEPTCCALVAMGGVALLARRRLRA